MSLFLSVVIAVLAGLAIRWLVGAKDQYFEIFDDDQNKG